MKMHQRSRYRLGLCLAGMSGVAVTWVVPAQTQAVLPETRGWDIQKVKPILAVASYPGGVNVATGDVDGDGLDDIVLAPDGDDPPEVHVLKYDKSTPLLATLVRKALPGIFPSPSHKCVDLSVGDLDGDGHADIIVSDAGGSVSALQSLSFVPANSGTPDDLVMNSDLGTGDPYPVETIKGGVRVAVGDVSGDGVPDIITAAHTIGGGGGGGGGSGGVVLRSFDTFVKIRDLDMNLGPDSGPGVRVATGDVDGDGHLDIVVAHDTPGGTELRSLNYAKIEWRRMSMDLALAPGDDFDIGDIDGDDLPDLIVGTGEGSAPLLRYHEWRWLNPAMTEGMFELVDSWNPFPDMPGFTGGVRVALADFDGDGLSESVLTAPGVPEPGVLAGAAIAGAMLLRTRRRRC